VRRLPPAKGRRRRQCHLPAGRAHQHLLRGMVEQCNTELNLSLFPDEVTAIAAVLNQTHYRFR
jgi:hypothetical protein